MADQCRNVESDEQLLHAFTTRRDEDAFAVLVRRHGSMVFNVCRRVLEQQQDAEDAFQATFLLLARGAVGLRNKAALASFLHGTAYRISLTARRSASRRRKHEERPPARPPVDPVDELSWREVRTLLDEEIARLPEKYRTVFVLCCLEELSQAEAAGRLGMKERTLSSQLAAARKQLAQRLARRGIELTTVLSISALATQSASALPAGLRAMTIKAAMASAAGEGWTSMVSASVAELIQAASAAAWSKGKMAAALLLAATLLAGGSWWRTAGVSRLVDPDPAGARLPSAAAQVSREDEGKAITASGYVVDPVERPIDRAKLLFLYHSGRNIPKKVWSTSTADGRFTFALPAKEVEMGGYGGGFWEKPWENTYVLAAADGYGFAVARVGKSGATDLMLRLVKDDVPIRGRILDLQGKPVAGVQVRINGSLYTPEKGDLTAWLNSLKDVSRDSDSVGHSHLTSLSSPAIDLLFPPVTTGADGRFCIQGIGRERVADLRIEGPTIATQVIHVMTRSHETLQVPEDKNHPKSGTVAYFGAEFDFAAAPTRLVVGSVRDKDSGKPLAGVTIESETIAHRDGLGFVSTTTDKNGRYRLVGLPKSSGNKIVARTYDCFMPRRIEASNERPYLASIKQVGNPLGLEPVTLDFALKRGVWVKGRVTEQATGKSLFAARIEYFCFVDNPGAKEVVGLYPFNMRHTEHDGSYRIAALPGRGLITVRGAQDHYIMGVGAERISRSPEDKQSDFFSAHPYFPTPVNYHALVEIAPKPGDESITCDVQLVAGRSLRGTVFDPDGKPLDEVRVAGLRDMGYWSKSGAQFTVESLQSNKPRLLQFVHDSRKLSGFLSLKGDEKGPLSLRLQPWGILIGRLITDQGEPLAGANVGCGALGAKTGKDGRFRIEGLAAGLKYDLFISKDFYVREVVGGRPKGLTIKAGDTRDLGELRIKPVK
jgi:RNA polymerase sigma factor (sigma-70 family)